MCTQAPTAPTGAAAMDTTNCITHLESDAGTAFNLAVGVELDLAGEEKPANGNIHACICDYGKHLWHNPFTTFWWCPRYYGRRGWRKRSGLYLFPDSVVINKTFADNNQVGL